MPLQPGVAVRVWALAALAASSPPCRLARAGELPPSQIHYRIDARIDPARRALSARQSLSWRNSGAEPVREVPLHLYLNAFAHSQTTWFSRAEQQAPFRIDLQRLLARYPDPWGWIELQQVVQRVAGQAHDVRVRAVRPDDQNPLDRSLVLLTLARPVAPGERLQLELRFRARLPRPIARTGCSDDFCMVAQWYPKIAVRAPDGQRSSLRGWGAHQFQAATEFFADFADVEVTLDLPAGWQVGGTGRLEQLDKAATGRQRVRLSQRAVHDVALALGRGLGLWRSTLRPGRGPAVRLRLLAPRGLEAQAQRMMRAVKRALEVFSRRIGPYPYQDLTVVLPPWSARATSGMEYPTLISGHAGDPLWDSAPLSRLRAAEATLVHELAHQYFYGLLASDEQQQAALDEGLTSYWEGRATRQMFGTRHTMGRLLGRPVDNVELYRFGLSRVAAQIQEPVAREPSFLYYPGTYPEQVYFRPALALWTATRLYGEAAVDRLFAAYYRRHRFTHPRLEQLLALPAELELDALGQLLREAVFQPRVPDYRVSALRVSRYTPPVGHLFVDGGGGVMVRPGASPATTRRWVGPRMRDGQGKVWLEIRDPGWRRGGRQQQGSIHWRGFAGGRPGSAAQTLWHSEARVRGPGWDQLPVTVELRFADGVTVRERWDGRAAWRGYRAVRGAPLEQVLVDPEQRVLLDVSPQNNGLSRQPSGRMRLDWGGWIGALCQWLAAGVASWL